VGLALGAPAGAVGGALALFLQAGGYGPDLPFGWAALAGAVVLTPPWAVYVAVRAAGVVMMAAEVLA
jgi:hypothetical protein